MSDDPLDKEISVSGELTETGIKGTIKSRTASALDRLVGNIIDYFNPDLEARSEAKRAKTRGNTKIIEAMSDAASKAIAEGDAEYVKPAIEVAYKEILIKQENKDAVVRNALEDLRQLDEESRSEPDNGGASVADDWLNFFSSYAEKASSETLRQTFGRILSGEIKKPGSFSFTALRIVSELDRDSARFFQVLGAGAFSMGIKSPTPSVILRPDHRVLRGDYLGKLQELESLGLLQEIGGNFGINLEKSNAPNGRLSVRAGSFLLRGEFLTVAQVNIGLIKLTRPGTELCSIIPMSFENTAREIGRAMARQGLLTTLHRINHENPDGTLNYSNPGEKITG